MDDPTRAQAEALAGLEPLRLEFPYARKMLNKRVPISVAAILSGATLIPMFFVFREHEGIMRVAVPIVVGLCVTYSAVLYFYWKWHEPQVVLLQGLQLHVGRRSPWKAFDQVFDLLSIHDLHLTGPWSRFENKPANHRTGSPPPWALPEPFGFTCDGRAHSFGGAPAEPQELERVMAAITSYDRAVRLRLGMAAEPGIATLDRTRIATAAEDGWDSDVPLRALW